MFGNAQSISIQYWPQFLSLNCCKKGHTIEHLLYILCTVTHICRSANTGYIQSSHTNCSGLAVWHTVWCSSVVLTYQIFCKFILYSMKIYQFVQRCSALVPPVKVLYKLVLFQCFCLNEFVLGQSSDVILLPFDYIYTF